MIYLLYLEEKTTWYDWKKLKLKKELLKLGPIVPVKKHPPVHPCGNLYRWPGVFGSNISAG